MTPRTKEQNEEIRLRRIGEILRASAEVYLDKGILLEIRDVAAAAELGYGTVYHYYKNKSDLLSDMLHQAMDRAEALWDVLRSAKGRNSKVDESLTDGGARMLAEVCTVLLRTWEADRALFLACHLGTEQYRTLPGEVAAQLIKAYQTKLLLPLAVIMEARSSTSANKARSPAAMAVSAPERQAEWLLAALAACALPSLRRGTIREDQDGITRFMSGIGSEWRNHS